MVAQIRREAMLDKCVVCQRSYEKKKHHQVVCSSLCKKSLNIAQVRVRRLRERFDNGKLPSVRCTICSKPFKQRQSNFVTCGEKECVRLRNIETNREWLKQWPPIAKCIVCRKPFKRRHSNYVTCGRKECIRLRKLETKREWRKRWNAYQPAL